MNYRHRTQARMLALQALCLFESLGDAFQDDLSAFLGDPQTAEDAGLDSPPEPGAVQYARRLAADAWATRARADALLTACSPRWSVSRMPVVDRNILRLAICEMRDFEEPAAVVIDEAIGLARRFGDQDTYRFVNGMLDEIRRRLEPGATPSGESDSTTLKG